MWVTPKCILTDSWGLHSQLMCISVGWPFMNTQLAKQYRKRKEQICAKEIMNHKKQEFHSLLGLAYKMPLKWVEPTYSTREFGPHVLVQNPHRNASGCLTGWQLWLAPTIRKHAAAGVKVLLFYMVKSLIMKLLALTTEECSVGGLEVDLWWRGLVLLLGRERRMLP